MSAKTLLLAIALCCGWLPVAPASASLTKVELDQVKAEPVRGTTMPERVELEDVSGTPVLLGSVLGHRPAVMVLADYECGALCGPILSIVAATLSKTGLRPGLDFDLVVVGLNPDASAAAAGDMKAAQLDGFPDVARSAHVLRGSPEAVRSVEAALNYRAVFDRESHRYAHPADIFILTREGAISRMLPGLALDPSSLRLALVEAGQGGIGTLGDQLHLFCYGLDPAIGRASRPVHIILIGGGLITLGALALFVARAQPQHRPTREGEAA